MDIEVKLDREQNDLRLRLIDYIKNNGTMHKFIAEAIKLSPTSISLFIRAKRSLPSCKVEELAEFLESKK